MQRLISLDEQRNIVARPYLGLSAADEAEVLEIVEGYFEQGLG